MAVQGTLWLATRYPSTTISVFLTGFLYVYEVATQLSSGGWVGPLSRSNTSRKISRVLRFQIMYFLNECEHNIFLTTGRSIWSGVDLRTRILARGERCCRLHRASFFNNSSRVYRVLKNNVYNVSGMIEEVKTNMFIIWQNFGLSTVLPLDGLTGRCPDFRHKTHRLVLFVLLCLKRACIFCMGIQNMHVRKLV